MNSKERANAKLYVNSPANVLGIFPPYIELFSKKRKGIVNKAATIGTGKSNFISLKA